MRDALFGLDDFRLCHALKSLLPVLVHMDLELVEEISWLYVGAILIEDVAVSDKGFLAECRMLMCFTWRYSKLIRRRSQ